MVVVVVIVAVVAVVVVQCSAMYQCSVVLCSVVWLQL